MNNRVVDIFNHNHFEEELIREMLSMGRTKKARKNEVIISPDVSTNEIPMVITGLLKLLRKDDSGNEILLYYLEGGETCAMSITCCLEGRQKAISVVAEEDSELWMIPMSQVDRLIQKYLSFRKFVFRSYQDRFDEMLTALDSVAFMNMDQRLMKYLLDTKQAFGSYVITKTHQQIANELNTSRVVISRLLKKLENEEKIEQHRNRIEIL